MNAGTLLTGKRVTTVWQISRFVVICFLYENKNTKQEPLVVIYRPFTVQRLVWRLGSYVIAQVTRTNALQP